MTDAKTPPDRRKFLLATLGAVTTAGGGVVAYDAWREEHPAKFDPPFPPDRPGIVDPNAVVTARRRLGRTGLDVSVVAIGAGNIHHPDLIARAVDKGMNYVDTSICYGDSEKVLARAFREHKGLREKLVVATKWDAAATAKKSEILSSLDKSLERLDVDYVDVMQLHWLGGGHVRPDTGVDRLDNPELYLAMEEAKKSGKVRFFGATSHDAKRAGILAHAIDNGAFDVILVKMNVLDYESAGIPALLAHAAKHDVGVVAMKSQPSNGALPPGYENSRYSIYQANLRWVLAQPGVTTVVHSLVGSSALWQDAAASATKEAFTHAEGERLEGYAAALSPMHCRGCLECSAACPEGVALPHVLQFDMYADRYGWIDRARTHYRALPAEARFSERCLTCSACTEACPHGVDAAGRVRRARALG